MSELLWKNFKEQESCDNCPLLGAELCSGGWSCYGGDPVEPPCCSFDDDTDLIKWVADRIERRRQTEERKREQVRKEHERAERAQKAARTRLAVREYCRSEICELKRAEKALKNLRETERRAENFASAINLTNEMFGYRERVAIKSEITDEIKLMEQAVFGAKDSYEAKRKEFYASRNKK